MLVSRGSLLFYPDGFWIKTVRIKVARLLASKLSASSQLDIKRSARRIFSKQIVGQQSARAKAVYALQISCQQTKSRLKQSECILIYIQLAQDDKDAHLIQRYYYTTFYILKQIRTSYLRIGTLTP